MGGGVGLKEPSIEVKPIKALNEHLRVCLAGIIVPDDKVRTMRERRFVATWVQVLVLPLDSLEITIWSPPKFETRMC